MEQRIVDCNTHRQGRFIKMFKIAFDKAWLFQHTFWILKNIIVFIFDHTGSSRKNEKSKLHSRGVSINKILIFTAVPGRKIVTNNSPTPSRSLRNVVRLPSKVAPPTLAEWKSGSGSPKSASKQPKTGLWPAKRSELGSKQYFSVIGMQNWFSPKIRALWVHWGPGSTRQLRVLGSWSLIFTQPTLEAQPLREASKNFWEIWMEWGSNLSLFFYQEQLWKSKFCKNKHLCYVIYFSHSFWMTLYIYFYKERWYIP